jgi:hypothetical protein
VFPPLFNGESSIPATPVALQVAVPPDGGHHCQPGPVSCKASVVVELEQEPAQQAMDNCANMAARMGLVSKLNVGLSYIWILKNWPAVARGHVSQSWPSQLLLRDNVRLDLLDSSAEIWAFRSIWMEQCYESSLPALPPDGTVIDLGANVGIFSVYAASRLVPHGRVIAVEPDPRCFEILARNSSQLRNVSPMQAALGLKPHGKVLSRLGFSWRFTV